MAGFRAINSQASAFTQHLHRGQAEDEYLENAATGVIGCDAKIGWHPNLLELSVFRWMSGRTVH